MLCLNQARRPSRKRRSSWVLLHKRAEWVARRKPLESAAVTERFHRHKLGQTVPHNRQSKQCHACPVRILCFAHRKLSAGLIKQAHCGNPTRFSFPTTTSSASFPWTSEINSASSLCYFRLSSSLPHSMSWLRSLSVSRMQPVLSLGELWAIHTQTLASSAPAASLSSLFCLCCSFIIFVLASQWLSHVSLWCHELQHTRPPCPSPLPEFAQTHVHRVGDAIQPSHPLSSPSPPALNLSQHQGLLPMSHFFASGLEHQLQHQSFQWIFRVDFL